MITLTGSVDIHLHSGPSYSHSRPYDDEITAKHAFEEGLAGIVIKDHTESTVTRAYLAQKAVPGIRVFGGITLNHPVGGINPEAADFALTMGGKEVWMPTVDSARHAEVFGQGGYALKGARIDPVEPEKKSRHLLKKRPISILVDGKLTDEAKDVVKICQIWDAMLGTSHLSEEEIVELGMFAQAEGFQKLIITHANWTIVSGKNPLQFVIKMAQMSAWIEMVGSAMYPPYNCVTVHDDIRWIKEVNSERVVLASDTGAAGPAAHEPSVFRSYLQLLNNAGLPMDRIKLMGFDNPRRLVHMA